MKLVIATFPGREHWLADLMEDVHEMDPVVVHGWEMDAIQWAVDNMGSERFLLLQDSWRILDLTAFLHRVNSQRGSFTISDCPKHYGCYAGVYEPDVIRRTDLPIINDKEDAITHETVWTSHYIAALGYEPPCLYPGLFHDSRGTVIEHHGRKNLMLGNDEIRKYKGTWR